MTIDQIDELIAYLGDCVEEGYVDSGEALDLIKSKDWKAIDEMRDKGDYYANEL